MVYLAVDRLRCRLDRNYVKAYYRRASANMALGKYKAALKDLRQVVKAHPSDKDAQSKFKACDRASKEAAFAAAINQADEEPLCSRADPDAVCECCASPSLLFSCRGAMAGST